METNSFLLPNLPDAQKPRWLQSSFSSNCNIAFAKLQRTQSLARPTTHAAISTFSTSHNSISSQYSQPFHESCSTKSKPNCWLTYIHKRPNIGNALRGLFPGVQLEKDGSNKTCTLSHMSLGVISTKHQYSMLQIKPIPKNTFRLSAPYFFILILSFIT